MENQPVAATPAPALPPALVPAPPKGLASAEVAEIKAEAKKMMALLLEDISNRAVVQGFQDVGVEAQQQAARELELLNTKVGSLLTTAVDGGSIPKDLTELRLSLDKLNPASAKAPTAMEAVLWKIPVIGKSLSESKAGNALKKILISYEPIKKQVDAIIFSLRAGKDKLLKDTIELEQLYDLVATQQLLIQQHAFLGELLAAALEERLQTESDPELKSKIKQVLHAVIMRVGDLRTMEQVNLQFFVSIDITTQNNHSLGQSVSRTLTVTTTLITVGLAIQAALQSQKQVLDATAQTQAYAADLLQQNAAAIRKQTGEIAALHSNPVLSLDKVQMAYDDLMAALDETEKVKDAGCQKAKEGIMQLQQMSSKLQQKVQISTPRKTAAPAALEQ